MKKLSVLLCFLLMFSSLSALAEGTYFIFSEEETEATGGDIGAAEADAAPQWTYPVPLEILEDPLDLLVLANKENLLDSDYPPEDELHKLVNASVKKTKSQEMLVRTIADAALVAMFEAAESDGAKLLLHSAYRSHRTQSVMYENRLKSKGYDDGYVQAGGASDHQTGLGFDVINNEWIKIAKESGLNSKFATTAEGQWMAENCAKFGFIIRYPEDKVDVTGIHYEPWHLRYVGVEVAMYMTENGMCLEEFVAEYRHEMAAYNNEVNDSGPVVDSFVF